MTDPVTTAVETVADVGTSKLELIFISVVCLALVYAGWYSRGVYERASVEAQAVQAVKAQQAADTGQAKEDLKQAKHENAAAQMDAHFNNKVAAAIAIKTPKPSCTLPKNRKDFINQAVARKEK